MKAIRDDFEKAPLGEQDRSMLRFVKQLTLGADKLQREDLESLRAAGFTDHAILQIAGIASWFNYVNRMADALGVGRDSHG